MPFDPKSKARYHPLSDRLRLIRNRLGETQEQMAFHFKVCKETYSRWERYMLPQNKAALIGIKYVLQKLDDNQARSRIYQRKHGVDGIKERNNRERKKAQRAKAREDARLAAAADRQPGE